MKILERLFDYKDDKAPSVNKALGDAMDDLQPGRALHMTRRHDGMEFIVMAADDFEHIAGLAGLRSKPVTEEQS